MVKNTVFYIQFLFWIYIHTCTYMYLFHSFIKFWYIFLNFSPYWPLSHFVILDAFTFENSPCFCFPFSYNYRYESESLAWCYEHCLLSLLKQLKDREIQTRRIKKIHNELMSFIKCTLCYSGLVLKKMENNTFSIPLSVSIALTGYNTLIFWPNSMS